MSQKVAADLFWYHIPLNILNVHSNYPDVYQIPTQSNSAQITAMQHSLSQFAMFQGIFTDNGPCLACSEYQQFAYLSGTLKSQQQHYTICENILRKCKDPSLGFFDLLENSKRLWSKY